MSFGFGVESTMKKTSSNSTPILPYFGILIVGVTTLFCLFITGCEERQNAEGEARAWASSLGMADVRVNCTNMDSNHDGYVSCSIIETVNGRHEIHAIECASRYSLTGGCRMQKPSSSIR
jgi:flagellar basal body-associated protein FliL